MSIALRRLRPPRLALGTLLALLLPGLSHAASSTRTAAFDYDANSLLV